MSAEDVLNHTDQTQSQGVLYQTIVYSITIPLFILTTMGNGVILLTIKFQARLLSSTSNYFILSLAFADFFVGIVIMPIMIVYTANKQAWTFSTPVCDTWMAIDFLCSSASFLTLSMMSIERYKMLTNSYAHIKHSSKMRILLFISLSWLIPLISWLPTIIVTRLMSADVREGECYLPAPKYLILGLCVIVYHIPLICMVTFYTKLIIYIKKSSNTNLDTYERSPVKKSASSLFRKHYRHVVSKQLDNSYFNSNDHRMSEQNNSLTQNNYFDNNPHMTHRHYSLPVSRNHNYTAKTGFGLYYTNKTRAADGSDWRRLFSCFSKESSRNQSISLEQSKYLIRQLNRNKKRNIISRTHKNLNIHELVNNSFNNSKSSPNRENNSIRHYKNDLRFQTFSPSPNDGLVDPCHFTLNSNESKAIKSAGANLHKEFSSELTSHDTNKRCSIVTALSTRKKDSIVQMKIYESSNYKSLRLKRNRKAARMLGILVAAFSVCWLPFIILYPLSQFYPNVLPGYLTAVIWWMGYLNSTINPFLYVYTNKNIRRSVRILFCQRMWGYCTGSQMSKNFRSDSLKNNVAIYPNGF